MNAFEKHESNLNLEASPNAEANMEGGMKKHVELFHKGLKSFSCDDCGRKLISDSDLKRHTASDHEGIRPQKVHLCSTCGGGFTGKKTLEIHIRTVHEGKKPHLCSQCVSSFGQKGDLNRHIRSVHEKIKPFSCPIESCTSTFFDKKFQKSHIEAVHEGIKPHECNLCGAKFAQKG